MLQQWRALPPWRPGRMPTARRPEAQRTAMQLLKLVESKVRVGIPLPWNVRNQDCTLLLAQGHVIHNDTQLETLLERGMFVDMEEYKAVEALQCCSGPDCFASCAYCLGFAHVQARHAGTRASLGKLFTNRFWLCRSDARTKTAPALGDWARPAGTARGQLPGFAGALRPLQTHLSHTSHQLVPCHPQV